MHLLLSKVNEPLKIMSQFIHYQIAPYSIRGEFFVAYILT